jgi:hypothetical protein
MWSNQFPSIAVTLLSAWVAVHAPAATPAGMTDPLIKPPLLEDPRRSIIEGLVRSTYPELFRSSAGPGWVAITLLMNRNGTLYRSYTEGTQPRPYITNELKAFKAMGVDYEHYSDRVQLEMRGGPDGGTRIYVRAYFLDTASGRIGEGPAAPNDDPTVNRAIAERYFPDLYTFTAPKGEWPIADFWVLLGQEGKVRATGRRFLRSGAELKLYLESLYPGIRTEGFQPTEFDGNAGRQAVVNFIWLAADSPVTDPARADLSKRGNVALYADISDAGNTKSESTNLVILKFGSPAIAVADDQQLDLQVTAIDGGADTVILRTRIQQVARAPASEFEFGKPNAVETAWPPDALLVHARYGKSVNVRLADQNHRAWKVVLHPDRIAEASSLQR